jgi:hypothetical protein
MQTKPHQPAAQARANCSLACAAGSGEEGEEEPAAGSGEGEPAAQARVNRFFACAAGSGEGEPAAQARVNRFLACVADWGEGPFRCLPFRIFWLAVAYASGLLMGCSQVRLVRDAPDGGVVAIPNNTNQWPTYYRNRAEQLMKRKCPEGYVIVSEQAAEDNPAARDGRKPNEDFDYEGAYIRLSTYDRKVYHIVFRSVAAAKKAPPQPSRPAVKEEHKDELPPPRPLPTEPHPGNR